ncbi:MAG: ferredoxin [Gammaproteobacteria bacterium]|jgi:hypothetical protein|nr:ferredoxin [Gammaproteobacteria bacterium]
MQRQKLTQQLQAYGLRILSQLATPKSLQSAYPWAKSLLLIGQGAQGYWRVFSQSAEYQDGQPDPIDRWSLRIGDTVANTNGGVALYPFTGPPYWPFLAWSQTAGDTGASRLGLHLHRTYGLWHSYRFALLLPAAPKPITTKAYQAPCSRCEQPCVDQCPVDAFADPGNYQVDACRHLILNQPNNLCMTQGCQARLACPEGQGSHERAQHQYHMQIFARG